MNWMSLSEAADFTADYIERTRGLKDCFYSTWHLRKLCVDAQNRNAGECGVLLKVRKDPTHKDRWQIEQKSLEKYLDECGQPHKAHKEHKRVLRGRTITVRSSRLVE